MSASLISSWNRQSTLSEQDHGNVAVLKRFQSIAMRPVPAHARAQKQLQDGTMQDSVAQRSRVDDESESIENVEELYAWLASVELEGERMQEQTWQRHVDKLKDYKGRCRAVLAQLVAGVDSARSVSSKYNAVMEKSAALHSACEQVVAKQEQAERLRDAIERRLRHFDAASDVARWLAGKDDGAVSDERFVGDVLARLDDAIAFVDQCDAASVKESAVLGVRLRQLQSRAIALMRSFVCKQFAAAAQKTQADIERIHAGGAQERDRYATESLLYVKFREAAPRAAPVCAQVEARASNGHPPFAQLLEDLHESFSTHRRGLMLPRVSETLAQLLGGGGGAQQSGGGAGDGASSSPAQAVRSLCAYVVHLSQLESELAQLFFRSAIAGGGNVVADIAGGDAAAAAASMRDVRTAATPLLRDVARLVYDALRPVFIRSHSIDTLCAVANILTVEVLNEQLSAAKNREAFKCFAPVASAMLGDVQERLVFLAQTCIRDTIVNHRTSADDIDYPARLARRADGAAGDRSLSTMFAAWFPTLEKTLMMLSKLYLTVNTAIFEGIAQEALHECTWSLVQASQRIAQRNSLDGQLFFIMHLLVLRDQIKPFDIDFQIVERTLDFSPLRSTLGRLVSGGFRSLFSSLADTVRQSSPRITSSESNSKRDLEQALSSAVNQFINAHTQPLIADVSAYVEAEANAAGSGAERDMAAVRKLFDDFESALVDDLLPVVGATRLYLAPFTADDLDVILKKFYALLAAPFSALYQLVGGDAIVDSKLPSQDTFTRRVRELIFSGFAALQASSSSSSSQADTSKDSGALVDI
jgi:conserved oligomeric Golgi complex subunit 3